VSPHAALIKPASRMSAMAILCALTSSRSSSG